MINSFRLVRPDTGKYVLSYTNEKGNVKTVADMDDVAYANVIGILSYIDSLTTEEERIIAELNDAISAKEAVIAEVVQLRDETIAEKELIEAKHNELVAYLLEAELTDQEMLDLRSIYPNWSYESAVEGVGVEYAVGYKVNYNNNLYKVIQAHTSQIDWNPEVAVSLFVKVVPPEVIPNFVQPTAENPYNIGDKVLFNGIVYESTIDNNVWSPTAYPGGWKLV